MFADVAGRKMAEALGASAISRRVASASGAVGAQRTGVPISPPRAKGREAPSPVLWSRPPGPAAGE